MLKKLYQKLHHEMMTQLTYVIIFFIYLLYISQSHVKFH